MTKSINFRRIFSLLNVKGIIIFEDSFDYDNSRSALLYDLFQLNERDKYNFFNEISENHHEIKLQIEAVFHEIEKAKLEFVWEEIPQRELEAYANFKKLVDLSNEINKIQSHSLMEIYKTSNKYGIGLKRGASIAYDNIFDEISTEKSSERISQRIYEDFTASIQEHFTNSVNVIVKDEEKYICIIDNFMGGQNRGIEIAEYIKNSPDLAGKGIFIILSSKDKDPDIKYPFKDNIYVDYVYKNEEDLVKVILSALIKSQYFSSLNCLEELRSKAMSKAYKYAADNLDTAIHLSHMAGEEGATNYSILKNWLKLREDYYQDNSEFDLTRSIIILSSVLTELNDEFNYDKIIPEEMEKFAVFEEYDYKVNEFHEAPAAGDIFCIENNYYLMVGQECDMTYRVGKRNSVNAELVKVDVLKAKKMSDFKEIFGQEKIILSNFRAEDDKIHNISIDCTKRYLIDFEVLDLCSFNKCGTSKISLEGDLDDQIIFMLPNSWGGSYAEIQKKLKRLKNLTDYLSKTNDNVEIVEALEIFTETQGSKLKSLSDSSIEDGYAKFDVKRICRIKNHMNLINRVYYEYRGRMAFNTINYNSGIKQKVDFVNDSAPGIENEFYVTIIYSNKRNENQAHKLKNRPWVVNKIDIVNFVRNNFNESETILIPLESEDDHIILNGSSGFLQGQKIEYKKISKDDKIQILFKFIK